MSIDLRTSISATSSIFPSCYNAPDKVQASLELARFAVFQLFRSEPFWTYHFGNKLEHILRILEARYLFASGLPFPVQFSVGQKY